MGHRLLEKLTTFIIDALAINGAFWFAFWFRFQSGLFSQAIDLSRVPQNYVLPSLILTALWLVFYFFNGLYREWYKESRFDEFLVVSRTVFIGIALFFLVLVADQMGPLLLEGKIPVVPRAAGNTLLTYGISLLISATTIRFLMHTFYAWLFTQGFANQKLAIVGANSTGLKLVKEIAAYPQLGYSFAGFIDESEDDLYNGYPVFGSVEDIPRIVKEHGVNGLIISHMSNSARDILSVLNYCWDERLTIYLEPSLMDVISGHLKTHEVAGVPLIVLLQDHMPRWEAQIKRLFDIVISLLFVPLFLIMWVVVKVAMRFMDPGPAIYTQERIGQNGKPFTMMKFRSMYTDAEARSGPQWATENDPRITPLGRFMRKTRIDEIPQVINVLKGEMSFVGPRPERQHFIEMLTKEIPWYVKRLKMKPGVTGWAQVKHKYDETIDDVKTKVMYDLYYFENMSLALDLKIIVQTVLVVLTGKGAK